MALRGLACDWIRKLIIGFYFSNDLSVFDVGEVVSCTAKRIYRKNNWFFRKNTLKHPYIMI